MRGLAASAAVLIASSAVAGELEQERAEVEQRLAIEKAALAALKDKKVEVLEVLELLSRLDAQSRAKQAAANAQLRLLRRRIEIADARERASRELFAEIVARLAPRVRVMYRMTRRSPLDVLLSASDFASMVWRSRALSTLLSSDLALVAKAHEALESQKASREDLEALRSSFGERMLALEQESALAEQEHGELSELVNAIGADQEQQRRVVHELERAEEHLNKLIQTMQSSSSSAFGQLRGHLPFPVHGMIEVGYGRVVNPRFNTVTVQKGLDIRAPEGTPVRAIAPGKVVFAGWLRGYGNILIVDHGSGFHSLMAHLAEFQRQVGDSVKTGDELATVGDTGSLKGAYLYFELREAGQAIDPAEWLTDQR